MFKDLRGFIEQAKQLGELKVVEGADWNKEIGAITELMAERKGPAVLFDKIKDYPPGYRVLGNGFGSAKNTALVLGTSPDSKPVEILDTWRQSLKNFRPLPPVVVKKAPVKENIVTGDDINLYSFPAPVWHERDGGRYIGTGTSCVTRDPDEGWVNLGAVRCMIVDKKLMTVGITKGHHSRIIVDKYHARGQSAPVAICMGEDPVLFLASGISLTGWGTSEYDFTGWARGEPVEVVKGEFTDLPIPATAELVIEGEIPPPSQMPPRLDGPFGEWIGHYTQGMVLPVIVKAILHRNDPIILGAPPFQPPRPWFFGIPLNAGLIWNALEASGIPSVTGVWHGIEVKDALWLVIRIRQEYAGHAKQAALAASACRQGCYGGKFVIVVDHDIDITNTEEVIWAMISRANVDNVDIIRNTWTSPGDHASISPEARARGLIVSSKIIIDACWPYDRPEPFNTPTKLSSHYRKEIIEKWSDLVESRT